MARQEQRDQQEPPKKDRRIDEYAVDAFIDLGYGPTLPDEVVKLYREFKRRNDLFRPSRLTPEAFVFISIMADLGSGSFAISAKE